jgi:hypothetical protein
VTPFATAKAWFIGRNVRERSIMLLFLAVVLIIWGHSFLGRATATQTAVYRTGTLLRTQEQILELRPLVDQQLSEVLARIEPGRTLSATRLNAELAGIGARLQLNPDIPPARTERVDRFMTHATEVLIRRTSYEKLIEFAGEIAGRSPYLNLEQIQISADRTNPALLDARFRITAVELTSRQP